MSEDGLEVAAAVTLVVGPITAEFVVNADAAFVAATPAHRYVLAEQERCLRAAAHRASPPRTDPKPSQQKKRRGSR